MISTLPVAAPSRPSSAPRRVGQFAIGMFAGCCASFVPRLMVMIGESSAPSGVTVQAFSPAYVLAAFAFSALIGGVVMILEWDGKRPPRDTFMAALGVPALLTSMLNTSSMSREVLEKSANLKAITDQLANEAGIPVEEDAPAPKPEASSFVLPQFLMPVALAQGSETDQQQAQTSSKGQLGVRYNEPAYWIVLRTASTREAADKMVSELRRYGSLRVEKVGAAYYVCPEGGALPYSKAVSKAADLKQKSRGGLSPKLVRAAD